MEGGLHIEISTKQIQDLAYAIYDTVEDYINNHQQEYKEFLREKR